MITVLNVLLLKTTHFRTLPLDRHKDEGKPTVLGRDDPDDHLFMILILTTLIPSIYDPDFDPDFDDPDPDHQIRDDLQHQDDPSEPPSIYLTGLKRLPVNKQTKMKSLRCSEL